MFLFVSFESSQFVSLNSIRIYWYRFYKCHDVCADAGRAIGNIHLSPYEVTAFKNCSDLDTRKRGTF